MAMVSQYYNQRRYCKAHKKDINLWFKEYYKKHKLEYQERNNKSRNRRKMYKAEVNEMKKRYPNCFKEL
jgi:hypothetical protein